MYLAIISLLTGLAISAVAIYYSVVGLTAIFAAAAIPIMVMGVALEVAKLVATVWLKQNWKIAPSLIKTYLVVAVGILMFITSMGIFGFLSKAHMDQSLVSGDVQSKIAIYDQKIQTAKENIETNRKALKQMDEAVDQVMGRSTDEKGADKAVQIRRSQAKERTRLQNEIAQEQKLIAQLNDEAAPIRAEVRKVEAEVGPIKYIAAFVYGENPDANILEKAVTWVIIIIVFVFDPLAVVLLLAAQYSFARVGIAVGYEKGREEQEEEEREARLSIAERIARRIKGFRQYVADGASTIKNSFKSPIDKRVVEDTILEPVVEAVTEDQKAEGDSLETESNPDVVAEEVTVTADSTMPLDEMKDKLKQFVNKVYPMQFTAGPAQVSGFTVPKINSAIIDNVLPTVKSEFTPVTISVPEKPEQIEATIIEEPDTFDALERPGDYLVAPDETEVPFGVSVDDWNKLIAEAEKAVESEFNYPTNPVRGQRVNITVDGQERHAIYNGETWINADESNPDAIRALDEEYSKFQILHELRDHGSSYVQNEEQDEKTLWKGLTQEAYQQKVQEANIRELVLKINSGEISVNDLTDAEASAIAEYLRNEADSVSKILKKERDDGQDNADKSA